MFVLISCYSGIVVLVFRGGLYAENWIALVCSGILGGFLEIILEVCISKDNSFPVLEQCRLFTILTVIDLWRSLVIGGKSGIYKILVIQQSSSVIVVLVSFDFMFFWKRLTYVTWTILCWTLNMLLPFRLCGSGILVDARNYRGLYIARIAFSNDKAIQIHCNLGLCRWPSEITGDSLKGRAVETLTKTIL